MSRLPVARVSAGKAGKDATAANKAGALPKRSAVDIVVSLIYDIEKALAAGKVATPATEDVMGAFDAILRNRMTLRLREQGWPDFLIR